LAQGHWLAMEAYQHSTGFDWTVMSANTGSIQERGEYTGRFRLGNQTSSSIETARTYISRQDFAIAVIDMAESRTVYWEADCCRAALLSETARSVVSQVPTRSPRLRLTMFLG
jgi:hypothetical protein